MTTIFQMTNNEDKIKIIKRWMAFFYLEFADLGFDEEFTTLEQLSEEQLDVLLDDAEEDRMRHASEGIVIKKDWSDAVEMEM